LLQQYNRSSQPWQPPGLFVFGVPLTDFITQLELSVKTSNLLRANNVNEVQFINLTKERVRQLGGLVKSWKEIEELQPIVREARIKRRRESTIGRACIAVKELNDLAPDLEREDLFITKDSNGRFRVGRFVSRRDFDHE